MLCDQPSATMILPVVEFYTIYVKPKTKNMRAQAAEYHSTLTSML